VWYKIYYKTYHLPPSFVRGIPPGSGGETARNELIEAPGREFHYSKAEKKESPLFNGRGGFIIE